VTDRSRSPASRRRGSRRPEATSCLSSFADPCRRSARLVTCTRPRHERSSIPLALNEIARSVRSWTEVLSPPQTRTHEEECSQSPASEHAGDVNEITVSARRDPRDCRRT
jgi:hypothetical protein